MIYKTTFVHPKYGEQHTDRKTKEEILQWLSYMIEFHEIRNNQLFEVEVEGEIEKEIKDFNIDKHSGSLEDWREFLKNRYNARFERDYKSKGKGMIFEAMFQLEIPEWDGLFYFERDL